MPAETEPDCERGEGGADDCKAEAGAGVILYDHTAPLAETA